MLQMRYIAEDKEAEITDFGVRNADADGSGKIGTDDVTAVLQIVAKKK